MRRVCPQDKQVLKNILHGSFDLQVRYMVCCQLLSFPALDQDCSRIAHISCQQLSLPVYSVHESYNSCGTALATANTSLPEAAPKAAFRSQQLLVCLQRPTCLRELLPAKVYVPTA